MRKAVISLTVIIAVSAILFTGCKKKDETSSPATIDLSKSATIKGFVQADLDLLNDTNIAVGVKHETAPAGTKLIIKIAGTQFPLNPTPGITYDDLIYTASVGSDGFYSVSVPTTNRGVDLTITPVEFTYDQVQVKILGGHYAADGTKRKVYTAGTINVNGILSGDVRVEDILYSNN